MIYDYPTDNGSCKVDTDNFDDKSSAMQMLIMHIGRACSGPTADIARLLKEGPPEPGMIITAISQHRAGWSKQKAVGL
jgi:hypothetical protein